ncbi:oligosaccharide flippase family protein [Dechloromonas sp. A34]|uniref:oligosaccharide flippase family protein n=1 Tax=Dechloromonas sp. A34 TaxID=447588 RepID=UPI00224907EC|nr:oligosaccharide flippase family protein [Dechloromonas sp. A34]
MTQRVAAAYGQRQYSTVGEYFVNGLVVYLGLSAGFVAVGMLLSFQLPLILKGLGSDEPTLSPCFQMALGAAGLGLVNECLRGFSNAMLRPAYPALALAAARIAGIVLTILLLHRDAGLWAIPIGMLVTEVVALVLGLSHAVFLIRSFGISIRFSLERIKEYIWYGGMLFVSLLSQTMARELDPILITFFLRPEITAAYMITRKAADIVFQLQAVVYASTHSAFSHLAADGNTSRTADVAARLLGLVFFSGLVGFSGYIAFNAGFVALWVGNDLVMGQEVIVMIGIAYFLSSLRNMVLQLLNGVGEFRVSSRLVLLESVARMVLAALLLMGVGVQGVPLSMIFSCGAMLVIMNRMLGQYTSWQLAPRIMSRAAISSLVMIGFAFLLASQLDMSTWLHFILFAVIGMAALLLVMVVLHIDTLKKYRQILRSSTHA